MRRVAKQTARALEEQNDAINALATNANDQGTSIAAMRKANGEQATASEQIASAVADMRGRIRETVSASGLQAKGVATFGREMESLLTQIARVRVVNSSQAEAVANVSVTLANDALQSGESP